MIRKILIFLVLLIAILGVVIAVQPAELTVSRSATMATPPTTVFDQVNDFHKWEAWSPWAKLDPNAKETFEGPPSGTGAIFKWSGNSEVGEGQQTIVESRPGELVRIKLEFIKPFPGTSEVTFAFKPEAAGTLVTWTMAGKKNFIMKAMGLVMDCDKMMGGAFEQGLASLKAIVEAAPKA